jgi:hypothetical protein
MYGLIAILLTVILIVSIKLFVSPATLPQTPSATATPTQPVSSVSPEEQQAIEAWIKKNDLNFFGDPKDTGYVGGTPLYDETTGKTKDRFEYILENHQDRPWNN